MEACTRVADDRQLLEEMAETAYRGSKIWQQRAERMRAALTKYGDHTLVCKVRGELCSCGYQDALDSYVDEFGGLPDV